MAAAANQSSVLLVVRLATFVFTLVSLIAMDVVLVPANDVWVPRQQRDFQRHQHERKLRIEGQNTLKAQQEADVELAMFELDAVLKGAKLDPNSHEVKDRLEKLRAKFGGSAGNGVAVGGADGESDDADAAAGEDEDDEDEGGAKPAAAVAAGADKKVAAVVTPAQQTFVIDTAEDWSKLRAEETEPALAELVDAWIAQGKTKRLGIDILDDPLYALPSARSPLLRQGGKKDSPAAKVEVPKALPGDAQRRFVSRPKPAPPGPMATFCANLRETRTYSHMSKAVDAERRLKELGYKQSTGHKAKAPLFMGAFGETCPHFDSGEKQVSFCNYHLPTYREQEQLALLLHHERSLKSALLGHIRVENFFPMTWRLYKQQDRRALRSHTQNESVAHEGGPYVNKFSFSHGAGIPSITVKMYNQLKKSDDSTKAQVKEAKQKMIAQKYINNPYLYEGRKFIIRTWAIVVGKDPMMVLYHDGALLRSMPPYSPFTKRDGSYKRAAHFTNAQSTHKGTLRSSALYATLGQFQQWLDKQHKETPTFVRDSLRPRLKARMIYALYAMMRPTSGTADLGEDESSEGGPADLVKKSPKLPPDVVVVQPICFDFLLDAENQLWLLGAQTTGTCAVNLGGDSFRPPWKIAMQTALADRLVDLGEEMIWRRVAGVKLDSLVNLHTDVQLDALIDETLPGWSHVEEIKWLVNGGHVDGGLGARDLVEAGDDEHSGAIEDKADVGGVAGDEEALEEDEGEEADT